MTTVEMHVATALLPDLEAIRDQLNGHEAGRRPHPNRPDVTILDMQMDDAPSHAAVMEPVMRRTGNKCEVVEVHYWDQHGIFLAPVVPFPAAT